MAGKKRSGKSSPGRQPQEAKQPDVPDSDDLLDAAEAQWANIVITYGWFADKKPVMLYDLQEERIYAYPYLEFKKELSERSQRMLEEQYEEAVREGKMVVFVRDNERRRLRSFTMPLE